MAIILLYKCSKGLLKSGGIKDLTEEIKSMISIVGVLQQVTRIAVPLVGTVVMILSHSFVFRRMVGKALCLFCLVLFCLFE